MSRLRHSEPINADKSITGFETGTFGRATSRNTIEEARILSGQCKSIAGATSRYFHHSKALHTDWFKTQEMRLFPSYLIHSNRVHLIHSLSQVNSYNMYRVLEFTVHIILTKIVIMLIFFQNRETQKWNDKY